MRSIQFSLALVTCCFFFGAADAQAPDLSKISGHKEKVGALLAYCEALRNANPAKGAAAAANYPLMQQAAMEGLALPSNEPLAIARLAYYAAMGYYYQVKFDSAQYYFYKSLYAAEKVPAADLITTDCTALISVDHQLQQKERADSCKNIIQSILDTTRDEGILRDGYSALGSYYEQRSYYSTAQDYLLKSIAIRKRQLDTTTSNKLKADFAIQCYLLGKVYQNADQPAKSPGILNEGRPYMNVSPLLYARYLSSFVEVYTLLGQIDSALYYNNLLEEGTRNSPTVPSETVSANLNIAQYYINHHRYGYALPYVNRADSLADRSRSPMLLYQARMMAGRYFQETGKYNQAIPLLAEALPVAKQISTEHYTDILKYMALAQLGAGSTSGSLQYYQQYATALDSLTREKSSRNFADQETHYETQKKEQQIASLDKDNRLKVLELSNANHTRLLLSVALAALGIIALLLYFIYRNKEGLNRTLNERNEQLDSLNRELAVANDTKTRLFGIISHDLRSPVSRIVQLLQIQKERPGLLDEPTRRRHDDRLREASEQVLETMEDLLYWSKSQMQHFTPRLAAVDMLPLLQKEIHLLQESIAEKQLQVDSQVPASFIKHTDENFLQVILRNLLQNAVKYSDGHTPLIISSDADHLYISNISSHMQAALLNDRLQNRQVNSSESGLGLQITADLAASIGANISFRQDEGHRLTAILSFS